MKKTIVLAVCMLFVATAAFAGIANTKHDLSSTSGSGGYKAAGTSEICVFCHTPHGGGTLVPLWNRSITTATVYSLYTSATLNATMLPISGASMACMTCHDGSLSVVAVVNQPGSGAISASGTAAGGVTGAGFITGATTNLGAQLNNDHPVSFTYGAALFAADNGLKDPAGASVAARLFNTRVECASCHDVHNNTIPPFLVISNAGSALCLTCHNK